MAPDLANATYVTLIATIRRSPRRAAWYRAAVDDTPWLTAREQRAWRAYLAATRLLSAELDRELQRDAGIPHTYYEILVRLSETPGRSLRMSELAELSDSSRSRLSHAVARLEEAGWVRRETCETDRRGNFAILTDQGFTALEAAAPGHVAAVRRHLIDLLTPEQLIHLEQIMGAVLASLRDSADPAAGRLVAEAADPPTAAPPPPTAPPSVEPADCPRAS
jgi:DNA-binding MarR family transcriptional regulator